MSSTESETHLLVIADREDAEAAAREAVGAFGLAREPEVVRDALAGEDDAEDAQWLVVVVAAAGTLSAGALDAFASRWDGWHEAE
ncbi:hypothetical protein [Mangrovactinospora gilvigrisea]|uniref:hypothetical protein n=1 Tax=Mangrovactinospora gilvigrisea TaxID=1428644 RepID=UPI000A9CF0DE|nr:hypothetical protein [Mangrovactinospora gilvigrisea]